MPSKFIRTDYCLDQASQCSKAATEASAAELKEAYANLEQGWLRLAPPLAVEGGSDDRTSAPTRS
jgi:hypothetical protein